VDNNIRMDLGEVEWDDVDWIGLAKDKNRWRAFVSLVIECSGCIKYWGTIGWPHN
jgi:hypothetical protein